MAFQLPGLAGIYGRPTEFDIDLVCYLLLMVSCKCLIFRFTASYSCCSTVNPTELPWSSTLIPSGKFADLPAIVAVRLLVLKWELTRPVGT